MIVLGPAPLPAPSKRAHNDADDAFPNDAAASIDTDGDGYPDAWNGDCDVACQVGSSLRLDGYPADPSRNIVAAVISRGVDNIDVGFSTTGGGWLTASGGAGFVGADFRVLAAGTGAN